MRARRALPLVGWVISLLVGLAVFHGLGRGPMAVPALTDPSAWGPWLESREALVAFAAVLRLVVLALAWYLVGVTTVGLVARLLRAARLVRLADALTVPFVRRLLQGALGVGLATTMVGAATVPTTGGHLADADRGVSMVLAGADEAPGAVGEASPATSDAASTPLSMRLLEQDDVPDGGVRMRPVFEEASGEVTLRPAGQQEPDPAHRVAAGESLWSIAKDTLALEQGGEPSDTDVLAYWERVVDHNRPHLADPDNPDLIFPGDEVRLPSTVEEA